MLQLQMSEKNTPVLKKIIANVVIYTYIIERFFFTCLSNLVSYYFIELFFYLYSLNSKKYIRHNSFIHFALQNIYTF